MSDDSDADDSSNVISKADEFIRRRRARNTAKEEQPPIGATDDIPVLTDVVGEEESTTEVAPATDEQKDFSAAIAREMDAWLDENLPQVVVHALDGITDRLISQIHESARVDLLPRLKRALQYPDTEADEQ